MVGYVWFGVSQTPFSGMKIGWIYDIQVLTSHRGRGVGEALMKRALDLSKSKGFQVAGLMVNAKNAVAMSLYGKLGFQTGYMIMFRQETNATPTSDGQTRNYRRVTIACRRVFRDLMCSIL